jgi:hypothetical protein
MQTNEHLPFTAQHDEDTSRANTTGLLTAEEHINNDEATEETAIGIMIKTKCQKTGDSMKS